MTLTLACLAAASVTHALSWVGNTRISQSGGQLPYRGAFLEPWQRLDITTETWPINTGQRVVAVVTTNNWQSSQEFEFSFQQNVGNNSRWRLQLPSFVPGSQVNFYIRATRTGQPNPIFDSNAGANFSFLQRMAPPLSNGPILQWFDTDYRTMLRRLPEVIEAGYSALYVPAPSKASGGGFSAGYDPVDRFDLGDRLQKGGVRTRFGTTQELQELIRVAKRLGLQVYCDLVTNHNANRSGHPISQYPDMIPEDFHIRSSADTGNNEINFNTESAFSFGMLNHELVGLVDIAHEDGNNTRTGAFNLPSWASMNVWGKPSFVRNATVPQLYPNNTPVSEDVREYLDRWVRWLAGTIGFDGFRIDAVKHTPPGYFGWAPDQAAAQGFSNGNLIPRTYSLFPNTFFFGEVFSTNNYELREYAKTGMNLLDFPLNFNMKSLFNQNGFGDLGSLGGGYVSDPATGLFFQQGGLSPDVGVSFVQSHDEGPPTSNNIAHAFMLGRAGRAKIYYDGNNIQPGNWTNFPRPGRFDALGNGSDLLTRLVNASSRFGRGYFVNRWQTQDLYVFERQVNGRGVMLVGLNDRGVQGLDTVTVQTAFSPGTVLVDYSGNRPDVTVDSNSRVTISVPTNHSATEANNGRGYVMYAPRTAEAVPGVEPVEVQEQDPALGRLRTLPFQTVSTPAGTYSSPRSFRAVTITQDRINLRVRTDAVGHSALVRFNNGVAIPGFNRNSNTPEGLSDGFIPMTKSSNGVFSLNNVDLRGLEDGLHIAKVRVFSDTGSDPGAYRDFNLFFYVRRGLQGVAQVDGDLADVSTVLATQSRNPSSNLNRLDSMHATNDDRYLYIGLAGRVDPTEGFTNGVGLAMDLDGPAGVRNLATVNDDSGPAARLVSNTRINLPVGFGADYLVGVFRNTSATSSPEAPFAGGIATPFPVGASASAFRVNAGNLQVLNPIRSAIATQIRANRTDPARGIEIAIPLTEIFGNALPPNPGVSLVAWLGTTGEKSTFLPISDPNRAALGGRPAAESFVTNQFLPSQSAVVNDPGTGSVTLATSARFDLLFASPANSNSHLITPGPIALVPGGTTFRQTVEVRNTGATTWNGPLSLRLQLPAGVTLANRTGMSLIQSGRPYITLGARTVPPNGTAQFRLEYIVTGDVTITPAFELFVGRGAL